LELAVVIGRLLDELSIRYVIGGSVAASLYGEPRSTLDLDVMIEADEGGVIALAETLHGDFFVDRDDAAAAARTATSFSAIHLATSLKVDFFLAEKAPFAREQRLVAAPLRWDASSTPFSTHPRT
jgi:hypothetical protein